MEQCISRIEDNVNYDVDFLKIKKEIAKISDVNYKIVEDVSVNFLNNKYKDIRVAGYLVLANCYLNNIRDISNSILLYSSIISSANFYPLGVKARKNAVLWLNNNKILSFSKDKINNASLLELNFLYDSIKNLNENIKKINLDSYNNFNALDLLIKSNIDRILKEEEYKVITKTKSNDNNREYINDVESNPSVTKIEKQEEKKNVVDGISFNSALDFLIKESSIVDRDIAVNFSRILRWSKVKISADDNFRTSFPSLPVGAKKKLMHKIQDEDYLGVISEAERLFLIPGGQFNMELQYYSHQASQKINNLSIKVAVEFWLKYLVRKFSDVSKYKFRDGSPFVTFKIKDWFDSISLESTENNNIVQNNRKNDKGKLIENESVKPTILANFIFL